QPCLLALKGQQFQARNSNRTRLALHYLACTGQLVQRLTILLQSRVHRRYLFDFSTKTRQQGLDFSATNGHRAAFEHLTFGVAGGGGDAQLGHGFVTLVGIEQILGELGRLAEAQRQHTGRQRIETAGMSGLLGVEQPADLLQGRVGGEATRLVEQQDAADATTNAFDLRHALLLLPALAILGQRTINERRQIGTATHAGVVLEVQLRHGAQLHHLAQLHAQEAGGIAQHLQAALHGVLRRILVHHREVNPRMREVTGDFHGGEGHHAQTRILDLTLDQQGKLALHLIADALGTTEFSGHMSAFRRRARRRTDSKNHQNCKGKRQAPSMAGPSPEACRLLPASARQSERATWTFSKTSILSPTWTSLQLFTPIPHSMPLRSSATSSFKRRSDSSSPPKITTSPRSTGLRRLP